jgi:hypothetical protein
MNYFKELKTVLLGWSQMRRSCYVEKPAMKNYEEFKGYQYRVEFDESSGRFESKPLAKMQADIAPILFMPKRAVKEPTRITKKEKRYASF